VWPDVQPVAVGTLADLDAGVTSLDLIGQDEFTLRISEQATATGYEWIVPAEDAFNCITLTNSNSGDFTTGYTQFVFTALDDFGDSLTCNENISLVRSDNSANPGEVVEFAIDIVKKICDIITCPTGEVQDAYFCGCITEPAVEGTLIDLGDLTAERVARFAAPGEFFTIREPSYNSDGRTYEFETPTETELAVALEVLGCIQEVSRDDTGYWRQYVFEGITGNCAYTWDRSSLFTTNTASFEFRVFPTEEPPRLGTFFDMDTTPYVDGVPLTRDLSAMKDAWILIRANEGATD